MVHCLLLSSLLTLSTTTYVLKIHNRSESTRTRCTLSIYNAVPLSISAIMLYDLVPIVCWHHEIKLLHLTNGKTHSTVKAPMETVQYCTVQPCPKKIKNETWSQVKKAKQRCSWPCWGKVTMTEWVRGWDIQTKALTVRMMAMTKVRGKLKKSVESGEQSYSVTGANVMSLEAVTAQLICLCLRNSSIKACYHKIYIVL